MTDIVHDILIADVILADLTGLNKNVLYELGLAHASGKKVILVSESRTFLRKLPFDISAYRIYKYTLESLSKKQFDTTLSNALQEVIKSPGGLSSPYLDSVSVCTHRSSTGSFVKNVWRMALESANASMKDIFAHYARLETEIYTRAPKNPTRSQLVQFARSEYKKVENPDLARSENREQMPLDMTITILDQNRKFVFHPSKEGEHVENGHPFHVLIEAPEDIVYWQNRYSSERLDDLNLLIPRRNFRVTRLACRHFCDCDLFLIVESHVNLIYTLPRSKIKQTSARQAVGHVGPTK